MINIIDTEIANVTKRQICTCTMAGGYTGTGYVSDMIDKYDEVSYNNYIIKRAPLYTRFKYEYIHVEYDGPEDKRLGFCNTVEECIEQINELNENES